MVSAIEPVPVQTMPVSAMEPVFRQLSLLQNWCPGTILCSSPDVQGPFSAVELVFMHYSLAATGVQALLSAAVGPVSRH